jgi:RNA polymerase sigma-70 factor (ECF subfamily)
MEGLGNLKKKTDKFGSEGTGVPVDCPITQSDGYGVEAAGEDDSLVRRSRQGDMAAYGRLIEKHQDRLYNMIYQMVGNRDDAQELTQDAFVRALQGLKKFRGQASFYTWLFRIGYNVSVNHCHHRRKIRFTPLGSESEVLGRQADGLMELADPAAASPLKHLQISETRQRIMAGLESLDEHSKAIVILRDIEQRDYAEIARIMEIPLGTVKSRLFRARLALREKLLDKTAESD